MQKLSSPFSPDNTKKAPQRLESTHSWKCSLEPREYWGLITRRAHKKPEGATELAGRLGSWSGSDLPQKLEYV